jgi:hypothetical protein
MDGKRPGVHSPNHERGRKLKIEREQSPTKRLTGAPDCESVSNYLNLLPKSEQNSQDLENVDSSIAIASDANGSKISLGKAESVSNAITEKSGAAIGHNVNGDISSQTNNVENNTGITGITGTGHTINNYACPPEIIELIKKLISKIS